MDITHIPTFSNGSHLDIVFDGPPGHNAPRFVEVEDFQGHSVCAGEWVKRDDGLWALRITADAFKSLNRHCHAAGTVAGKDIDECARCGHDIRHEIHRGQR